MESTKESGRSKDDGGGGIDRNSASSDTLFPLSQKITKQNPPLRDVFGKPRSQVRAVKGTIAKSSERERQKKRAKNGASTGSENDRPPTSG